MAEIQGSSYPMGAVMEIMKLELAAIEAGVSNLVPTIIGDPGIGKSASLKSLAADMNHDHYILSLGALPMEFFSGLPDFGTETMDSKYVLGNSVNQNEKMEVKVANWTMSDIIRTINIKTEEALVAGKDGLLVLLDDIHLVEPMVQKYLFEFFQNKTLQNYRVHEKAKLVGAMNGKDSAGLEGFLSAVIDRMAMYNVSFDKEYWYKNVGSTLHPLIASFASSGNDRYFNGANQTDQSSPSPRSWTELSGMIEALEANSSNEHAFIEALRIITEARVGTEAKEEFIKHAKLFMKFNFAEIFRKADPEFRVSNDISDQILTAFMIRYMTSKADAEYLIHLIKANIEKRTFISILLNEFTIMHKGYHSLPDSKEKDAIKHLEELLTDSDTMDDEIVDMVCEALMDVG